MSFRHYTDSRTNISFDTVACDSSFQLDIQTQRQNSSQPHLLEEHVHLNGVDLASLVLLLDEVDDPHDGDKPAKSQFDEL